MGSKRKRLIAKIVLVIMLFAIPLNTFQQIRLPKADELEEIATPSDVPSEEEATSEEGDIAPLSLEVDGESIGDSDELLEMIGAEYYASSGSKQQWKVEADIGHPRWDAVWCAAQYLNKGYVSGSWDCSIYVTTVMKAAYGIDIAAIDSQGRRNTTAMNQYFNSEAGKEKFEALPLWSANDSGTANFNEYCKNDYILPGDIIMFYKDSAGTVTSHTALVCEYYAGTAGTYNGAQFGMYHAWYTGTFTSALGRYNGTMLTTMEETIKNNGVYSKNKEYDSFRVFHYRDEVRTGKLEINKVSADPATTLNDPYYSTNGAFYGLYLTMPNVSAKDAISAYRSDPWGKSNNWLVNMKETANINGVDGVIRMDDIPVGEYILIEVSASPGFICDTTSYWAVTVSKNGTTKLQHKNLEGVNLAGEVSSPYGYYAGYTHMEQTNPPAGGLCLVKRSTNPTLTDSNKQYSYDGAIYGLYRYAGGSDVSSTITGYRADPWGNPNLVNIKETSYTSITYFNGSTNVTETVDGALRMDNIADGQYILIELWPPQGYKLDADTYWYVSVTNGKVSVHKKSLTQGDLEAMVTGGTNQCIRINHSDVPHEPGWLQFKKVFELGYDIDKANPDYDVNGALYGLYSIPINATDSQAIAQYRANGYTSSTPYLVNAKQTTTVNGVDGVFVMEDLVPGDYLLIELMPSAGCILDVDTYWEVNVGINGTTTVNERRLSESVNTSDVVFSPSNKGNYATYVNHFEEIIKFTFDLQKASKLGLGFDLAGAEYTIYYKDGVTPVRDARGRVLKLVTDSTGYAKSPELAMGEYKVKETKAPALYDLDPAVYPVNVDGSTIDANITVRSTDAEKVGDFKLIKKSNIEECTKNNKNYSLEGAEFKLQLSGTTDAAHAYKLVTNKDGYAEIKNIPIGTYRLSEEKAPEGFDLDPELSGGNTKPVNVVQGESETYTVTDPAKFDPIAIKIHKANGDGSDLMGAVFTLKYYEKAIQGNPAEVINPDTGKPYEPTRIWKIKTGDGTNGTEKGIARLRAAYLTSDSDELFVDSNGNPGIPIGTVTVQETTAPVGYSLDPTINWYYNDGNHILRSWVNDGDTTINLDNTLDHPNESIPVNLEIIKKDSDTSYAQGSAGDTTLKGAVFAIYARRDIADVASGEVKVTKSGTYTERTPLTFSNGDAIKDQFGNQVYAEKGDPIPYKIFNATDEAGKTKLTGFVAAKNIDDYYVRELVSPKGFARVTGDIQVDLRDTTNKAIEVEAIDKTLTVQNKPFKQSVRIFKYENIEVKPGDVGAVALSGVEFQVFLLSKLSKISTVPTITNADGTVGYNFAGYDFSKETPEIVTADGGKTLVTDEDGYATTIPLRAGTYVLVETKELEGYHKLDPIVFEVPQVTKNADGSVKYEDGNPVIAPLISLNVENDMASVPIKINKRDAKTTELVTRSNATFSIWNVSNCSDAQLENPKENGTRVSQPKLQEDGTFTTVDTFVTDSEGFLLLQRELRYGVYAIVEEIAPAGYDKADPVLCKVALDGLYVKVDNDWIKATKYTDTQGKIYYEVNVADQPFELDIAKVDSVSNAWVDNAELTIFKAVNANGDLAIDSAGKAVVLEARDESGKFVKAIWNTSAKFKHFEVVPSGWYVLRETKTPDGYATMDDFVFFVGESDTDAPNGVRTVTGTEAIHYNYETVEGGLKLKAIDSKQLNTKDLDFVVTDAPTVLEISKVTATDSSELPGAKLSLYRIEGTNNILIDSWTSGTTPHVVKYIKPGKYKLVEDLVPAGFYNDEKSIEFTVEDTAEVQRVQMINYPTSSVDISKVDATNSKEVPGATLALYSVDNGNNLIDKWVSTNESHVVSNLKPGKYKLVEISIPDGYYATSTEVNFELETYGITKKVEMVNYPKSSAEISKVSATDGAEVPGAELALYYLPSEGTMNLIEEWTSTDVPHVVKGLMPGKYRLVENTLPLGYFETENTVDFDIETYGIVKQVEMVNHPIIASFEKRLKGTSTAVPGATMALYRLSEGPAFPGHEVDEDAEPPYLVERWVTTETPHEIECLFPGDYRLVEEHAPYGYTVAEPIEFTVTDKKQADPIIMYDELVKCYVKVQKHGEALTKVENTTCEYGDYTKLVWEQVNLAGIKFELYDEAGTLVTTLTTDSTGEATSEAIPFGTYKVREIVPDGWVDEHVEYTITLSWVDGMTIPDLIAELDVDNKACNTAVEIYKVGEEPVFRDGQYVYEEKPLSNVLFGIYAGKNVSDYYGNVIVQADTCLGYAITDETGIAKFESKLVRGEYYFKELQTAGPQYLLDNNRYDFEVILQNNQLETFKLNESTPILNKVIQGSIKVLKVDEKDQHPLAGAEFDLFNSDDVVIAHLITGVDGTVQTGTLPYGEYYLIETKAPEGYVRSDKAYKVSIDTENVIAEVVISNSTVIKLGTKDMVKVGIAVTAFFSSLLGLFVVIRRRKRRI